MCKYSSIFFFFIFTCRKHGGDMQIKKVLSLKMGHLHRPTNTMQSSKPMQAQIELYQDNYKHKIILFLGGNYLHARFFLFHVFC